MEIIVVINIINLLNCSIKASNKQIGGIGINFLKGILPISMVPKYFDSEWSFAQVRCIEGKSICAFSRDSTKVIVVCADGNRLIYLLHQILYLQVIV